MRLLAIRLCLVAALHLASARDLSTGAINLGDRDENEGKKPDVNGLLKSNFYYISPGGRNVQAKPAPVEEGYQQQAEGPAHSRTRRSATQQFVYVSQPRLPRFTYIRVYQHLPEPEPEPKPVPLPPPMVEEARHLLEEEHHDHEDEEHDEEDEHHETEVRVIEHAANPQVEVQQVASPPVEVQQIASPQVEVQQVASPQMEVQQIDTPQVEVQQVDTPQVEMSKSASVPVQVTQPATVSARQPDVSEDLYGYRDLVSEEEMHRRERENSDEKKKTTTRRMKHPIQQHTVQTASPPQNWAPLPHMVVANPPPLEMLYDKLGLLHAKLEPARGELVDLVPLAGLGHWGAGVEDVAGRGLGYVLLGPGGLDLLPILGRGGHVDWVLESRDHSGVLHDVHLRTAHERLKMASVVHKGHPVTGLLGFDYSGDILVPVDVQAIPQFKPPHHFKKFQFFKHLHHFQPLQQVQYIQEPQPYFVKHILHPTATYIH